MDIFAAECPCQFLHISKIIKCPDRVLFALQRTTSAFDRAAWAAQLAPLMKLWDSLAAVQPQMLHPAQQQQPAGAANAAPLEAFVAQEAAAARLLATAVHGSLASLRQTLAGTAVLTPAVQVSCVNKFTGLWSSPASSPACSPRQPCSSLPIAIGSSVLGPPNGAGAS